MNFFKISQQIVRGLVFFFQDLRFLDDNLLQVHRYQNFPDEPPLGFINVIFLGKIQSDGGFYLKRGMVLAFFFTISRLKIKSSKDSCFCLETVDFFCTVKDSRG